MIAFLGEKPKGLFTAPLVPWKPDLPLVMHYLMLESEGIEQTGQIRPELERKLKKVGSNQNISKGAKIVASQLSRNLTELTMWAHALHCMAKRHQFVDLATVMQYFDNGHPQCYDARLEDFKNWA